MAVIELFSNLSDDALGNMFTLNFGANLGTVAGKIGMPLPNSNLTLRVTEFTKPEKGYETYEQHFQTLKAAKPVSKANFANEFTFSMRVDRSYAWYKFFERWCSSIVNNSTGAVASDTAADNLRCEITVRPHATESSVEPGVINETDVWYVKGAMPKIVPSISYSQESGEPIIIEISMTCLAISDLGEVLPF